MYRVNDPYSGEGRVDMVNYQKQNIVKLAFNNIETSKSRNICITGFSMVRGSKTVLVAFALAMQNTLDLNART